MFITICNIYNFSDREKQLLPHFIKHYRDKLKTKIIFCCDDNNIKFQQYCNDNNIIFYKFNYNEYSTNYGIADSIRINHIKNIYQSWYIPVDLDEFIEFESHNHIINLYNFCINNQYKYINGYLYDKFVSKNTIAPYINTEIEIEKQFPYGEKFTKYILKACDTKVCLCSPEIDVAQGHHCVTNYLSNENKSIDLSVSHYKWFGEVLSLEEKKLLIRLKNKSPYFVEQKKLFNYFSKINNMNYLEHKIHLLIPFYNAENYLEQCIDSILSQTYDNYFCYLFDDASTDRSLDICKDYVSKYPDKFLLISNKNNFGPGSTKYHGLKFIQKVSNANDIVTIIDGDDYLANINALKIINNKYLDTKCWFTYGNCSGQWCEQGDFPPFNNFRHNSWRYTHPRSFKCGLIFLFQENDFKINDSWLLKATDRPIVYNCLEWVGYDKTQFITEPIYFYRSHSGNTINTLSTNIIKTHKEYVNHQQPKNLIKSPIYIVMCSWKRFFNIQKIIDSLDNQTVSKNIYCHIINNNIEHVDLFNSIQSKNIKLNIIHKNNINFTFEKLLYAKELYEQQMLDYVIFIDDDQYFQDSNFIEQLYGKKQPKSMITWFGKVFNKSNINYWQTPLNNCLKNSVFDYGGTGCCVLDCSILNSFSQLWDIDDIEDKYKVKKIEDLWLSYILSLYNWKIINSDLRPNNFLDHETEKYALWKSLKSEKQKLLEYLILEKNWKLLAEQ